MSRQADREGYPEVAEAFNRYAWEEDEHASKFAELLGDCVWDTKTNLQKRKDAEQGACEDKKRIATRAKALNLDAIHDTVHETVSYTHLDVYKRQVLLLTGIMWRQKNVPTIIVMVISIKIVLRYV